MVVVDAPSDENRGQATQAVQYEGQPSMHLIICFWRKKILSMKSRYFFFKIHQIDIFSYQK